jgi:hypothetical protein
MTMTAREIWARLDDAPPTVEDWHLLAHRIQETIERKIRERAPDVRRETGNGRMDVCVPLELTPAETRLLRQHPSVGAWLQQRFRDGVLLELDGDPPAAFLQVPRP